MDVMHRRPRPALTAAAALVTIAAAAAVIASRSHSWAGDNVQGDADCDTMVNAVDALHVLRSVAQLPTSADCLAAAGDTDCDGGIDSVDALRILRYLAHLTVLAVAGCVSISDDLDGTPTATPSPALTATATPTPAAKPSPSPAATPRAGDYTLADSGIKTLWQDVLDMALIPGAQGEAVVIRQNGQLWKLFLDGRDPVPFGDLGPIIKSGGEQGLLSLAFSPHFQSDGRLYVYHTRGSPQPSILSRYQATPSGLDESTETVILEVPQPYSNHNGGKIMFGQDGYLYLSLGDGGSAGDPQDNAQNLERILGKVLRIDVTGQDRYAIPPDNPFVGTDGRDEIYAYGFRNPWRMSQDRLTADIWLGDVGQNAWEEVDRLVKGGNYGWDCYEGFEAYELAGCPDPDTLIFPRAAYPNPDMGRAVVGGYVYRGDDMPELYGYYIYADTYSGRIWAVNTADNSDPTQLMDTDEFIYSFFELPDGELLLLTASGIYRLAPA